jgi:hypothetical protein
VTWTGAADWQRIFDFGNNDAGMGNQGTNNTASPYLFLTPRAPASNRSTACTTTTASRPRVAYTVNGPTNEACSFGAAAFGAAMTHVAVTISGTTMMLYIGGSPVGAASTLPMGLSGITDTHNWLGRSQYAADPELPGTIHEFRIYNTARSASEIMASFMAGANAPPTQ